MGKDPIMRLTALILAAILATSGLASAADPTPPDQLKKMYDDALVQLKADQDRINGLAKENEGLKAKTEELGKDLAASQSQLQDLKRDAADNAAKDFYLRAYHAAFENFLRRYPEMLEKWKFFMQSDVTAAAQPVPKLLDPNWPQRDDDLELSD
jgi:ABC-type transporter MlaC component